MAPSGTLLAKLLETLERSNIPLLASALTFDAILALIPLTILMVAGLGLLLDRTEYFGLLDPGAMIANFLPAHVHGDLGDPFALVEELLAKIRGFRSSLTWIAIPAFLWFSTRMFSAIRVCLTNVFHVRPRARPGGYVVAYLIGYVMGKARDVGIVVTVLALALVNTLLSGRRSRCSPPREYGSSRHGPSWSAASASSSARRSPWLRASPSSWCSTATPPRRCSPGAAP